MTKQLAVTMALVSILITLSVEFASLDPVQQGQGHESHWQLIERIQKTWRIRQREISEQLRKDPISFARRQLSAEEAALISECLKFVKDPKRDLDERDTLLKELRKYPHISMLDGFMEIAKQQPPNKEPWRTLTVSFMENAVIAIGRISDERTIEALIELVGSPVMEVRLQALEQLQKLIGHQLPKGYRYGDVSPNDPNNPLWKYDGGKQAAETLKQWWQQNKGKVKIYWQAVWWHVCS